MKNIFYLILVLFAWNSFSNNCMTVFKSASLESTEDLSRENLIKKFAEKYSIALSDIPIIQLAIELWITREQRIRPDRYDQIEPWEARMLIDMLVKKFKDNPRRNPELIEVALELLHNYYDKENEEVIDHQLLTLLIEKGINLKAKSLHRGTIFDLMLETGDSKGVQMVLDAGVDPNEAIRPSGTVPAHLVYIVAPFETRELNDYFEIEEGVTLIANKGIDNITKVMEVLNNAGADFNITNNEGEHILDLWVNIAGSKLNPYKQAKEDLLSKLRGWGLNFDFQDKKGNNVIHKLAKSERDTSSEMAFAINMGASPITKNKEGDNPLAHAKKHRGHPENIKFLSKILQRSLENRERENLLGFENSKEVLALPYKM